MQETMFLKVSKCKRCYPEGCLPCWDTLDLLKSPVPLRAIALIPERENVAKSLCSRYDARLISSRPWWRGSSFVSSRREIPTKNNTLTISRGMPIFLNVTVSSAAASTAPALFTPRILSQAGNAGVPPSKGGFPWQKCLRCSGCSCFSFHFRLLHRSIKWTLFRRPKAT